MPTIGEAPVSLPAGLPPLGDSLATGLARQLLADAGVHSLATASSASANSKTRNDPQVIGKAVETLFASILVKQMRQAQGGNLFGHDPGDVCGGLFDHFMSQHIAHQGSLGIGKMIARHLENRRTAT